MRVTESGVAVAWRLPLLVVAAGFDERLARFETVSRRYAMPVLKLDASKPLLEQVREQLGYHLGSRRF